MAQVMIFELAWDIFCYLFLSRESKPPEPECTVLKNVLPFSSTHLYVQHPPSGGGGVGGPAGGSMFRSRPVDEISQRSAPIRT